MPGHTSPKELSNISRITTRKVHHIPRLSRLLQGTEVQTAKDLLDGVVRILADISLETLMATFHEWL
jgi:hypothetical protein